MSTPYRQTSDTLPDSIDLPVRVGDSVRVVGQPMHMPKMTVMDELYGIEGFVMCGWFDINHEFHERSFRIELLVRC